MKRRIWLATGLVLLAALGVVAFQAYWTQQTYRQASARLRQDSQAALVAATEQALAQQQQRLLARYAGWLQDTTRIRIGCYLNPRYQRTEFTVAGIPARPTERTGVSFDDFKPRLAHITPAARAWFIRRFAYTTVRHELNKGFVMFHTQWLGEQLSAAQRSIHTSPADFNQLVATELQRRGLTELPFRVRLGLGGATDSLRPAPSGFPLALAPVRFGQLDRGQQVARVWLPAAPGVVLRQLQGVLLASGLLVGLVLGGAGYAVGTMRRQKRLAALKADFTHNMTHELKTPVAAIQLATDSLRQFELDAATTADYTALISAEAGRLGTLIDRILRSVVLEQAALPLARQPVAWLTLVGELAARHQLPFARAEHQLAWAPAGQAATVLGDATHLASALATLLDNALKYGGPHATLGAEIWPTTVALHLHDDGPGIAPAYQARVFEQFFRVPTGNVHAVKGYGLGLHYARQVAAAHGGTLTLHSQLGAGTTFTLVLPLAAGSPSLHPTAVPYADCPVAST
ncbi:MAG: sensor histidine kinase [Janthinobacterium lividum]